MLVFTTVNVTHLAPPIVRTTDVTYRTERASIVNQDGMKFIAIQVK